MATILSFLSGRQITDDDGAPQSGAQLFHYQAGTTNNLTVYSDAAGSTPHAQPVVCDAGGFVPLVYIDDTSDWKVEIQDENDVVLRTYDNLPAAAAEQSSSGFTPPLFPWTQVTSAASPVALTAADAGKAYECDTSGGSIEFDLPSAASVGNGKGFLFKKTSASNSLILDPSGSQTIDDSSTSATYTRQFKCIGIVSNGAEWYIIDDFVHDLATDTAPGIIEIAVQSEMETGTATDRTVTPGRQHFHPAHAKALAVVTVSGGTPTLQTSYNITSITDTGTGELTITIATDFSSANWTPVLTTQLVNSSTSRITNISDDAIAAGSIVCNSKGVDNSQQDPAAYFFAAYGDQA